MFHENIKIQGKSNLVRLRVTIIIPLDNVLFYLAFEIKNISYSDTL